jgi:hypothetical protein
VLGPALVHTDMHQMHDSIRRAIGEVLDPPSASTWSCSTSRPTSAVTRTAIVGKAPESTLACSDMSAVLNLSGWQYEGRVQGFRDGEVLDLWS